MTVAFDLSDVGEALANEAWSAYWHALQTRDFGPWERFHAKHGPGLFSDPTMISQLLYRGLFCLADENRQLAARVKTLSALVEQPHVRFAGPHQSGRAYDAGTVVVSKGSSWIALTTTTKGPDEYGPGAKDWALIAKRGRDGKDGTPAERP